CGKDVEDPGRDLRIPVTPLRSLSWAEWTSAAWLPPSITPKR
ncbi:MAG: hypothetical protein AVDCRST_MAG02-2694, partial [uncultured Rubrobacteraceae bacterium]